jgi:uncharacterized protein YecE (DUF72 family)
VALATDAGAPGDGRTIVHVGTSGWVYRDWRGSLYPPGVPQRRWLETYAERFPTVELNVTFYRLPPVSTFEGWRQRVPGGFVFAVKMSRLVTHLRRLRACDEAVVRFWDRARVLGPTLGPVLVQLPPRFAADVPLLEDFLAMLPAQLRPAVEFRDDSWWRDDVFAVLDRRGAALVLPDRPGRRIAPVVTGGWSYVRFHQGDPTGPDYPREKLRRWAATIDALGAQEVFAYFNNDPTGAAVRDATAFSTLLTLRPGLIVQERLGGGELERVAAEAVPSGPLLPPPRGDPATGSPR